MLGLIKKDIDFNKIVEVFAWYDLGSIIEEHQEIKGDVDLNYKIIATSGIYFLKYINNKINVSQFDILGHLHEYLREKEIPVPKIYKTKNGNYVENDFILYEFLDGEKKEDWSEEEMISLTSNFTKMLVLLKEYEVPDFVKNKNDKYIKGHDMKYCHDVFRPKVLELQISEETKNKIIKIIDLMYSKLSDFKKLPKFFIHGDLNEMNALFKDGKNIGIIDFGVGYDPTVSDLGEFCYWFVMPFWREEFNEKRFNLILKTFEEILPLSNLEKELLPYMILRRGMMDIMLTLQYYWASDIGSVVPEDRLNLLIRRNDIIINKFNLLN